MSRIAWKALLAGAIALGLSSAASAQSLVGMVQRSGNVYHVPACPGPLPPGVARCHARVVSDIQGNPLVGPNAVAAPTRGYFPADLRSAYNVGLTGSTSTIVIVDAYGYDTAEADLAVYRSQFGLPACTTANGCFKKLNQSGVQGSYPQNNNGWAQETALDLDMASAMCPSCKIVLVEATSATFANLAAAENTAALVPGAHVISNSYGGGETGSTPYESAYNHPGIAITVSSGDSGYGIAFPASAPHVIATGGTHLTRVTGGRGWAETVWSGAGSGCSSVYAKQSWQTGVTDANCPNTRMEADVSAVSDPATGVAVYGPTHGPNRGWLVFGGTSVAAPLIAGIYGANGAVVADYGSYLYSHAGSLYDVVSGSNGSCGSLYLCTAGPGYDGPTGLGTPNGVTAF